MYIVSQLKVIYKNIYFYLFSFKYIIWNNRNFYHKIFNSNLLYFLDTLFVKPEAFILWLLSRNGIMADLICFCVSLWLEVIVEIPFFHTSVFAFVYFDFWMDLS